MNVMKILKSSVELSTVSMFAFELHQKNLYKLKKNEGWARLLESARSDTQKKKKRWRQIWLSVVAFFAFTSPVIVGLVSLFGGFLFCFFWPLVCCHSPLCSSWDSTPQSPRPRVITDYSSRSVDSSALMNKHETLTFIIFFLSTLRTTRTPKSPECCVSLETLLSSFLQWDYRFRNIIKTFIPTLLSFFRQISAFWKQFKTELFIWFFITIYIIIIVICSDLICQLPISNSHIVKNSQMLFASLRVKATVGSPTFNSVNQSLDLFESARRKQWISGYR